MTCNMSLGYCNFFLFAVLSTVNRRRNHIIFFIANKKMRLQNFKHQTSAAVVKMSLWMICMLVKRRLRSARCLSLLFRQGRYVRNPADAAHSRSRRDIWTYLLLRYAKNRIKTRVMVNENSRMWTQFVEDNYLAPALVNLFVCNHVCLYCLLSRVLENRYRYHRRKLL